MTERALCDQVTQDVAPCFTALWIDEFFNHVAKRALRHVSFRISGNEAMYFIVQRARRRGRPVGYFPQNSREFTKKLPAWIAGDINFQFHCAITSRGFFTGLLSRSSFTLLASILMVEANLITTFSGPDGLSQHACFESGADRDVDPTIPICLRAR